MTDRYQERATKVVQTFKAGLSEAAYEQITDAQFEDLYLMIRSAISEELLSTAHLIEDLAKQIRMQADRPELGL